MHMKKAALLLIVSALVFASFALVSNHSGLSENNRGTISVNKSRSGITVDPSAITLVQGGQCIYDITAPSDTDWFITVEPDDIATVDKIRGAGNGTFVISALSPGEECRVIVTFKKGNQVVAEGTIIVTVTAI